MGSSLAPQDAQTATRYLLALAGGWLATHGYIPNADINDLVSAIMILGPIIWGIWVNHRTEDKAKVREMVAVQAGLNLAASGGMELVGAGVPKPVTPETTKAIIAAHGVTPTPPVQPVTLEPKP